MPAAEIEIEREIEITLGADQRVALILLGALLLSFVLIRISTRLMRSPKVTWWPGSVTSGDLHIHHLVFGIVMVLVSGFLMFAYDPDSPWAEILAGAFGVGAGLTLDEYALWLHLEDVYWAEEGRRSVDAVAIAAVFAGLVIVLSPLETEESGPVAVLIGLVAMRLALTAIAIAKGKYVFGLVGLFVPGFSEVAAIRLARPNSPWARWRYGGNERKMAKARGREVKWDRRRERWRDLVGGAPST